MTVYICFSFPLLIWRKTEESNPIPVKRTWFSRPVGGPSHLHHLPVFLEQRVRFELTVFGICNPMRWASPPPLHCLVSDARIELALLGPKPRVIPFHQSEKKILDPKCKWNLNRQGVGITSGLKGVLDCGQLWVLVHGDMACHACFLAGSSSSLSSSDATGC
jgi:hypothetical protein